MSEKTIWPDLPLAAWSEACDTLHLWTQIVGKVRIALTPLINHWWNATLLVTARGLAAPAMPYGGRTVDVIFDFTNHRLIIETSDCRVESFALKAMAVADFYNEFMQCLRRLGIDIHIWTMPGEIENAIPFDRDRTHAQYDPVYAQKFWLALLQTNRVMNEFRARFIGKASPVHFFWGSFDLCVTRFSGRRAPERPDADPITREAYSHEVISGGFWPGGGDVKGAAFYAYAAPEPPGFAEQKVQPAAAFYHPQMKEFLLMYDDVRQSASPREALLSFLESTYDAGASLARWDRKELERL